MTEYRKRLKRLAIVKLLAATAVSLIMLWLSLPASILAQAQTGKPAAQTEGHYTARNLPVGMDAYADFSTLPYLKNPILSEQQSSTDPQGGNDDGFEWQGLDVTSIRDKVLLDAQGPGVVYRMWFTGSAESMNGGRIKFFFDGESIPTYDFDFPSFFSGNQAPFLSPFVLNDEKSSGGYVVMLPIPFRERIVIKADMPFYFDINYQILPHDADIKTFDGTVDEKTSAAVNNMTFSERIDGTIVKKTADIAAGESCELAQIAGKNQINQLLLTVPDVFTVASLEGEPVFDGGIAFGGENNPDGCVEFTMALDPNNTGARLTRRLDYSVGDQVLAVYIDGENIGDWKTLGSNDKYRWLDASFDIPAAHTQGKSSVTVKLQYRDSAIDCNVFYLWMYSRLDEGYVLCDELDVENGTTENGFTVSGQNWSGSGSYLYNPLLDGENVAKLQMVTEMTRHVYLEIYYGSENEPSVSAPIGSFFGFGEIGPAAVNSYMIGFTSDGTLYCNFPMPFEEGASIRLVNRSEYALSGVNAQVCYASFDGDFSQIGYFKTQYRRYEPNVPGKYMTVLKTQGAGHMVGIVQTMSGDLARSYLEGDELVYIDGCKTASFYGTGTEDLYNGAWYFARGTFGTPWYGNPQHMITDKYDQTSCYRLFLADAINFRTEIDFKMEHGPHNDTESVQQLLAFYYHNEKAQMKQTDRIDLDKQGEIASHSYVSEGGRMTRFEGIWDGIYRNESVTEVLNLLEENAYSQFIINLDPENRGAILRKTADQSLENQSVRVYVNGVFAGNWNSRSSYCAYYARQDTFFIPEKFTRGKKQVQIKLAVQENCVWSEGAYQIFSVKTVVSRDDPVPAAFVPPKKPVWMYVLIGAGAAVLLAAGAVTAVILVKRRRRKVE